MKKLKIAAFDIGTTAVKGVLVEESGTWLDQMSVDITTYYEEDRKEQDPLEWYGAFCSISQKFTEKYGADDIGAIVMSGQMQDMIPVDKNLNPVGRAVLYSDGRAGAEADGICAALGQNGEDGRKYVERITGNHYDGSLTFPKVLWMKRHLPGEFEKIHKILISSKDYVIARLTGHFCTDVTAASTAGLMDIHEKKWDGRMLEAAGVGMSLFPEIKYAHEEAGRVTEKAAEETGYRAGTGVFAGTGDAGATTLASGIAETGEYNINLGTSGWVATVSDDVFSASGGVFNLAAMPQERYINVVPFLNAGNVHKWVTGIFTDGPDGRDYEKMNGLLEKSVPGSRGVLFLPYLSGERFPVMDAQIRGGYYGLSPETTKEDMSRSCLEGVAFSIRQGIESIGVPPKKISVIGGGGRVKVWCQILADVLGAPLYVYKNAEMLPSAAIASSVLLGMGKIKSYREFTDGLQKEENSIRFLPDPEAEEIYRKQYELYKKLYPAVCMVRG